MTNKKNTAIGGIKTGHADVRDDDQGQGNHSLSGGIDADLAPIEKLISTLRNYEDRMACIEERNEREVFDIEDGAQAEYPGRKEARLQIDDMVTLLLCFRPHFAEHCDTGQVHMGLEAAAKGVCAAAEAMLWWTRATLQFRDGPKNAALLVSQWERATTRGANQS